jgi:hypothetical protein
MKKLAAIAIMVSFSGAFADDGREIAGKNDFTKDYLEKVTDERAADKLRREQDRKDHEKYLREISRSR